MLDHSTDQADITAAGLNSAVSLITGHGDVSIDQLHAHFGTNAAEVAMLAGVLGGPPFSFTVHGPEEFDNVHAISLATKVDRAAFVVAISSYGRSQLCRLVPFERWSGIHIVRCGVDEAFLQAIRITRRLDLAAEVPGADGRIL